MFKINKLTDYALVLLAGFAEEGKPLAAAQLAQTTRLPAPTVAKVLKALARTGLLSAQRGASGGYALTRPLSAITVADVVTALEGPIRVADCAGSGPMCSRQAACAMGGRWQPVNHAIEAALNAVTLADMIRPAASLKPLPAAEQRTEENLQ